LKKNFIYKKYFIYLGKYLFEKISVFYHLLLHESYDCRM